MNCFFCIAHIIFPILNSGEPIKYQALVAIILGFLKILKLIKKIIKFKVWLKF